MSVDAAAAVPPSAAPAAAAFGTTGSTVPVGEPVYNEVVRFLYEEAYLLDTDRLQDWLGLQTPDIVYRAPVRVSRGRREDRGFHDVMTHFEEDAFSLAGRVFRLDGTTSAWAEDPPSRCRRLITNVLVRRTDDNAELAVTSSLLLTRVRLTLPQVDLVPAERQDVLRRTADGLRLARRTILLDYTVLGTANLAVFL